MINAIVYHIDDHSMYSNGIKVIKDIKQVKVLEFSYTEDKGHVDIYYGGPDPSNDYIHEFEFCYPGNLTEDLKSQTNNKIAQQIYICLKNLSDDGYAHIDLAQITEKVIKGV